MSTLYLSHTRKTLFVNMSDRRAKGPCPYVTSGKLKEKFIKTSFLNRKLAAASRLRNNNLKKSARTRSPGEHNLL